MKQNQAPITTGRTNRFVVAVLTSRLHRLLSRWVCVIDYEGKKSGRRYVTPTQYVAENSTVTILVGKHGTKNWWRNFSPQPHPLRICVRGTWHDTSALASTAATDLDRTSELLGIYLRNYPRAASLFPGDSMDEMAQHACLVSVALGDDPQSPQRR